VTKLKKFALVGKKQSMTGGVVYRRANPETTIRIILRKTRSGRPKLAIKLVAPSRPKQLVVEKEKKFIVGNTVLKAKLTRTLVSAKKKTFTHRGRTNGILLSDHELEPFLTWLLMHTNRIEYVKLVQDQVVIRAKIPTAHTRKLMLDSLLAVLKQGPHRIWHTIKTYGMIEPRKVTQAVMATHLALKYFRLL